MTPRPRRPPVWTVGGLSAEARRRLHDLPGVNGALEARILLRRILGLTDLDVLAFPERPVPAARARRFLGLVDRRTAREPFAYLIGE